MIAETILNYAKEAGLEEAEVYQSQTQTLHFDILDGQPRQFVVSDKSGLSLRGTRQAAAPAPTRRKPMRRHCGLWQFNAASWPTLWKQKTLCC